MSEQPLFMRGNARRRISSLARKLQLLEFLDWSRCKLIMWRKDLWGLRNVEAAAHPSAALAVVLVGHPVAAPIFSTVWIPDHENSRTKSDPSSN